MKPTIDAKQAREDIRSGMSVRALMSKFKLSPKGLQSLLNKLVAAGAMSKAELVLLLPEFMKTAIISAEETTVAVQASPLTGKEVNAHEAARDIRSGMSNSDLMKKYGISPSGLEGLFEKLVGEALIMPSELQFRLSSLAGMANTIHSGNGRKTKTESPPEQEAWTCPACGRSQAQEYEECPVCGVIVAKFKPHSSR
jgi:rubrerythrin